MKNINQALYRVIYGKVSSRHLENILGGSLYRGLTNYQQYLGNQNLDFAELLLKSLGNQALFNRGFQKFLLFNVLNPMLIEEMARNLKIPFENEYIAREVIIQKTHKKIGQALMLVLGLDPDEFNESAIASETVNEEIFISPDPEKYLSLHDYQKQIKDEVVKNLLENPKSRMLVHMPTGSGKTKTCVEAIIDFLRTRPFNEGLVIWFAHSNELCSQSYQTLVETWKLKGDYPLPVFKIFGEHDAMDELLECKKGVVFVGFQKFLSIQKSKKEFAQSIRTHLSTNTQLVVIDEAHKSLALTYENAIDYVSNMPNCRVIGLTATPGRSSNVNDQSNRNFSDLFANKLITIKNEHGSEIANPLTYLQSKRVLASIEHRPIEIDLTMFSEAELNRIIANRELDQDQIEKIVESPIRNKIIVDEIEKALQDEFKNLVLVFACSTNHCILLQKLLEFKGITSEVVLGTTPSNLRERYISDFKKGKLKVLINYGVLTTGFDAPKLKTLIIARHTDSMILYSQMIGRALRGPLNGGNEKNYIIDLVDNISTLGNPDFLFNYWEEFWGRKYQTKNN
jgi:DNA repair protein RadD